MWCAGSLLVLEAEKCKYCEDTLSALWCRVGMVKTFIQTRSNCVGSSLHCGKPLEGLSVGIWVESTVVVRSVDVLTFWRIRRISAICALCVEANVQKDS